MTWNPLLLLLTLVFAVMASAVRADGATTAVIYVNGVSTTKDEAWKSVKELQKRLASEPGLEFGLAYNQTGCPADPPICIPDLYDAIVIEIETDVSQFLRFLNRLVPLPNFFQDALNELAASFDAGLITDDDLQEHLSRYETKFLQGKKVILVSHSQGNLFANQTFGSISEDQEDSFGIVSVAHPDRPVEGDDRFFDDHHTTLTLDLVITCLIVNCVPLAEFFDPLSRNVSNGINFSDFTGHSFVKSYLRDGSNSETKILSDILDVRGLLEQPTFGVEFTPSPSGNGRAVAFDPATGSLYYTITSSTNIFVTDANNTPATSINPGIVFGALAWDATREVLWGGGYDFGELGNVYQITPAGVKTFQFNFVPPGGNCYDQTPGFIDGLAYDEDEDTLWISDDAGLEVHHVDLSGNLIASYATPRNPRSGRRGCNTGIAVDGDFLWLALQSGPDQAPHDIVKVAKSDPTTVLSSFAFSNTNIPGPEDLELDLVTVPDTAALWSNQFGIPNALTLWKIRSIATTPIIVDLNGPDEPGIDFFTAYFQGAGAVPIVDVGDESDGAATIVNGPLFQKLTVTITNVQDFGDESLAIDETLLPAGVSVSSTFDPGSGSLTFTVTGEASVGEYNEILRTVTYENTSGAPTPGGRIITFVAEDADAVSDPAISTVTVVAIT